MTLRRGVCAAAAPPALFSQQVLALHPITGCWHRAATAPGHVVGDDLALACFDHARDPLEFKPHVQLQPSGAQQKQQHSWTEGAGGSCLVGARVEILELPGSWHRATVLGLYHGAGGQAEDHGHAIHQLKYDDDDTVHLHHMQSETFRVIRLQHFFPASSRRLVHSGEPPDCVVPRPLPIDIRSYQHNPRFHTINGAFPGLEAVHRDPWVFLVHDIFTDAECDALVDKVRPHLKPSHMGGGLRPDVRKSNHIRCFFEETAGVQRRLSALLNLPTANFEGLKVIKYHEGEYFKIHNDGFRNTFDPETGRSLWECVPGNYPNRVVTLVAYLNDVRHGGGTYFNKLKLEVRPRKGMGLLFMPSFAPTSPETPGEQYTVLKHEGRMCIDEKWICNQWGWGCEYIESLDPKSGFPPARLSATSI